MHALTALTLALAGSALAAPAIEQRAASKAFRLNVSGGNLDAFAILEAHVAAGQNAIEIQRPSAYQSEQVKLSATNGKGQLQSNKAGTTYSYVLPAVEAGEVKQVFTQAGKGTNSFGLNGTNVLTADGQTSGFYACPTTVAGDGKPFTLWYGLNADAAKLPSKQCQAIELAATYV